MSEKVFCSLILFRQKFFPLSLEIDKERDKRHRKEVKIVCIQVFNTLTDTEELLSTISQSLSPRDASKSRMYA